MEGDHMMSSLNASKQVVVGGGAGGVELVLAMHNRLKNELGRAVSRSRTLKK